VPVASRQPGAPKMAATVAAPRDKEEAPWGRRDVGATADLHGAVEPSGRKRTRYDIAEVAARPKGGGGAAMSTERSVGGRNEARAREPQNHGSMAALHGSQGERRRERWLRYFHQNLHLGFHSGR
jgi:hypothetical protein